MAEYIVLLSCLLTDTLKVCIHDYHTFELLTGGYLCRVRVILIFTHTWSVQKFLARRE